MNLSIKKTLLIAAAFISVLLVACNPSPDFGPEDWTHFIPKDTAAVWIDRYDAKHQSIAGRKDSNNLLLLSYADDFNRGKWMMGTMMAKKNVKGFRIYYGIKFTDSIVPILVGLDTAGNDLYWNKPNKGSAIAAQTGPGQTIEGAMDMSQKSPPPPIQGFQMLLPRRFWNTAQQNNNQQSQ